MKNNYKYVDFLDMTSPEIIDIDMLRLKIWMKHSGLEVVAICYSYEFEGEYPEAIIKILEEREKIKEEKRKLQEIEDEKAEIEEAKFEQKRQNYIEAKYGYIN